MTTFGNAALDARHVEFGRFEAKKEEPHVVTLRLGMFDKAKPILGSTENRLHGKSSALRDQATALPLRLFGGFTVPQLRERACDVVRYPVGVHKDGEGLFE